MRGVAAPHPFPQAGGQDGGGDEQGEGEERVEDDADEGKLLQRVVDRVPALQWTDGVEGWVVWAEV